MVPQITSIWIALPGVALAITTLAVVVAWRGRYADLHPLCRRCKYDLTGLPRGSTVCSECGADLTRRDAIQPGHRAVRARLLWAGLIGAMPCAAWLAGAAFMRLRGIDPITITPTFLLARSADSQDVNSHSGAMLELLRRLSAQAMSRRQIDSVVRRALSAQTSRELRWSPLWGSFVETARAQGSVSDADWQLYLARAIVLQMGCSPPAAGRPMSVGLVPVEWRTGVGSRLRAHIGTIHLSVAGREGDVQALETSVQNWEAQVPDAWLPREGGPVNVRATIKLTITDGKAASPTRVTTTPILNQTVLIPRSD